MALSASLFLANADSKGIDWFFKQMDGPGIAIVAILVLCSFIGWGAMIGKFLNVSAIRKRNLGYELRLRNVASILSLEAMRSAQLCPYEYLTFEATQAFKRHRSRIRTTEDIALCMGHVENAIQRGIARNVQKYEEKMILLSSLVSGGPFLGLLGTVWGVMLTFSALDDKASISKMAPGVSGALMATLCGLLVAIPATFGYNFLLTHTKVMTTELENFASTLADRIELELQESARRNRERNVRASGDSESSAYADDGDEPRAPYEPAPVRPRQTSAPFAARPVDDEPVRRPAPVSSDFGPDAAGFDDDFVAPPRREQPAPQQSRPVTRLRETRSWDEVQ
jgi:biopolymer transport protein TolQ